MVASLHGACSSTPQRPSCAKSRAEAGYQLLQPVYSLNLVNAVFMPDLPDEFIHNYNIVHELHSDKIIEGLHLTFVELKKFKPQSIAERKMAVLWLRFLTEITPDIDEAPEDLLDNELTSKASTRSRNPPSPSRSYTLTRSFGTP